MNDESGSVIDASNLTKQSGSNESTANDYNNNKNDISPQEAMQKSCGCGKMSSEEANPSYIYALGRIEVRQPNVSVQKEYRQATGRIETAGQNDYEAMRSVLSSRANRYLV